MYVTSIHTYFDRTLGETVEAMNVLVTVLVLVVIAFAVIVWVRPKIKDALRRRAIRFSDNYIATTEKQAVALGRYFEDCMNEYHAKGDKLNGRLRDRLDFLSDELIKQISDVERTLVKHDLLPEHEITVVELAEQWCEQVKEINTITGLKI